MMDRNALMVMPPNAAALPAVVPGPARRRW